MKTRMLLSFTRSLHPVQEMRKCSTASSVIVSLCANITPIAALFGKESTQLETKSVQPVTESALFAIESAPTETDSIHSVLKRILSAIKSAATGLKRIPTAPVCTALFNAHAFSVSNFNISTAQHMMASIIRAHSTDRPPPFGR